MLEQELESDVPGGLLADDCGCGKTYMMTCVIRGNIVEPTLIVTVVSVLHQWRDIMSSFGGINPLVITSDCALRSVPSGVGVVLTTYSSFTPKGKKGVISGIFKNTAWGRVVLDEGHVAKNPKSMTMKNLTKINSRIRWVLTATPVQNSLSDLDTLAHWIGWTGCMDEFTDEKMLRRTLTQEGEKNPRLKLPNLQSEVVTLDFQRDEEKAVYKRIEEEFKTRIERTSEGCRLYSEALQGILRCRQACAHWKLIESYEGSGSKRKRSHVEEGAVVELSSKFKFICDDIVSHPQEKVLVFGTWTLELNLLVAALDGMGIAAMKFDGGMTKEARENTLYNFREANGIRVLVVQIQSGGVGLNLQCATRIYITSPTWNPTHEIQAISRSHRLGQTQVVKCFRLAIRDTIEERMLEIQNQKMAIIADALNDDDLMSKLETVDAMDIKALFVGATK